MTILRSPAGLKIKNSIFDTILLLIKEAWNRLPHDNDILCYSDYCLLLNNLFYVAITDTFIDFDIFKDIVYKFISAWIEMVRIGKSFDLEKDVVVNRTYAVMHSRWADVWDELIAIDEACLGDKNMELINKWVQECRVERRVYDTVCGAVK